MGRIDTGDSDLDEALELEAELLDLAQDYVEGEALSLGIESLVRCMNAGSAFEATWRFCDLAGLDPEGRAPEPDDPGQVSSAACEALVALVGEHMTRVPPDEVVQVLVEAMDVESTRRGIRALSRPDDD